MIQSLVCLLIPIPCCVQIDEIFGDPEIVWPLIDCPKEAEDMILRIVLRIRVARSRHTIRG